MPDEKLPPWSVEFTGKARKQKQKLPKTISAALDLLWGELEQEGPERCNWPHYGPIVGKRNLYHCHLNTCRAQSPSFMAGSARHGVTGAEGAPHCVEESPTFRLG